MNGCSSSGKTSIARAIGDVSDQAWLSFGVDSFIDMISNKHHAEYFTYIAGSNKHGVTLHIDSSACAKKLFCLMPFFAKMLADTGHNVIIDEVLFDEDSLLSYRQQLSGHDLYYIGILCDLDVLQEREMARGDREVGMANDQYARVHHGILGHYDFAIDTTYVASIEAAKRILDFISF